MANLKNKKNVTKATAPAAASVQTEKAAETKTAAPKKEEAAAVKAAAPKTAATKTVAAKTEEKKAPVKKTVKKPVKKAETVEEVFVEYAHEQIHTEGLVNRIKEQYKNEGHRVGAIKSLRVYINLEHRRAYYVINDKHEESKFIEF